MIKKVIKYFLNYYMCKKNHTTLDCIIHHKAKICNTKLEGKNKITENVVLRNSDIGYGTLITGDSNINQCKIGKYCQIGFTALIGAHPIHDVVSIHPALYSTLGQMGYTYVTKNTFEEFVFADDDHKWSIVIGNDVWVTAGTTRINQGITIGDGAVVMEGAIVTKDVPPYAIVAGMPARVIGYRFEPDEIEFLLRLKWWDRDEEWIKRNAEYFSNIKLLMKKMKDEL